MAIYKLRCLQKPCSLDCRIVSYIPIQHIYCIVLWHFYIHISLRQAHRHTHIVMFFPLLKIRIGYFVSILLNPLILIKIHVRRERWSRMTFAKHLSFDILMSNEKQAGLLIKSLRRRRWQNTRNWNIDTIFEFGSVRSSRRAASMMLRSSSIC